MDNSPSTDQAVASNDRVRLGVQSTHERHGLHRRRRGRLGVCLALSCVCTLTILHTEAQLCQVGQAQSKDIDPSIQRKDKAASTVIPLTSVYYTLRQKGLKLLRPNEGDDNCRSEMRQLFDAAIRIGASNIFIARGDDVCDVVKATWEVFRHSSPVDQPVPPPRASKSDRFWLVAYLGTSGSHGEWLLKSVRVDGTTIRLIYVQNHTGGELLDLHPYFAWVPVGHLAPGPYAVEMFDEASGHVSLMRRITIPKRE